MVCANVQRMARALNSKSMKINGVATPVSAKLLNLMRWVVLYLCNAMEQLWDSNNNVITKTRKPRRATFTRMMSSEMLMEADPIWISAKMEGTY